jgi:hypothetical protein
MITFATCFYKVKSKFDELQYQNWMKNILENICHFNLIVYTNQESLSLIPTLQHPNLRIVLKEFEEFHMYAHKEAWIKNQHKNTRLQHVDWKLIMIWAEKVHFVEDARTRIHSEWYGWMDIGYFRGRTNDISPNLIQIWATPSRISQLDPDTIYYARVNNNDEYFKQLCCQVQTRNEVGLPCIPISPHQISIAGGFFLLHFQHISWWKDTFTAKVNLYFQHNYLIQDDQMILLDCYVEHPNRFKLIQEHNPHCDNWFLFQRFLL